MGGFGGWCCVNVGCVVNSGGGLCKWGWGGKRRVGVECGGWVAWWSWWVIGVIVGVYESGSGWVSRGVGELGAVAFVLMGLGWVGSVWEGLEFLYAVDFLCCVSNGCGMGGLVMGVGGVVGLWGLVWCGGVGWVCVSSVAFGALSTGGSCRVCGIFCFVEFVVGSVVSVSFAL
ncbi:hypothetical protein Tco_1213163 [Tanacetum coccineum]